MQFFLRALLPPGLSYWAKATVYVDDAYADTSPIHEPSSIILLGIGLSGIFGLMKKSKRGK